MKLKKSLGQHFLHQESILKRIVESINLTGTETVIEIGPGSGALTEQLLASTAHLICIETDADLIPVLETRFRQYIVDKKLTLVHADVLQCDFETLLSEKLGKTASTEYTLVGNIPYYITGQILRQALSSKLQPKTIAFVMQREVAIRIVAADSKQSLLSLSVATYGKPEKCFTIVAGSFNPPPLVDSALLCVRDISRSCFTDARSEQLFFEIIHIAFAQKRKQAVKLLSQKFDVDRINTWILTQCLPATVRAEDVTLDQWLALTELLYISP